MMLPMNRHISVLKVESLEALRLRPDSIVVDATLGSGGHAKEILNILNEKGVLVALDVDQTALAFAKKQLQTKARIHFVHRNFREIDAVLDDLGIEKADAILADLGWRTEQFEEGGRGLSFRKDEPLLMTYGDPKDYPFTAHEIVNGWSEESLVNVLRGYGEERFSGRIAGAIVRAREKGPVETSGELARIIENAVPGFYRRGRIHPATRTFQALRIAVNDELRALETFIDAGIDRLHSGGRLAIITFHSIDDRIVKHAFRAKEKEGEGKVLTKRPVIPTKEEVEKNPRARSAKLRVFEKMQMNHEKAT